MPFSRQFILMKKKKEKNMFTVDRKYCVLLTSRTSDINTTIYKERIYFLKKKYDI